MKKALLLLAVVCLPLFASAQTTEKQYYIYNIISFSGNFKNEGVRVDIDDGKTVEKLKDSDGNKIDLPSKLFDEIAPKYASERVGGYTRIVRLGRRPGDGAEKVLIELL